MEAAREIVEAILDDLKDRRGIGNELESIDPEIYNSMVETLVQITEDRLIDFRIKVQEEVEDRLL